MQAIQRRSAAFALLCVVLFVGLGTGLERLGSLDRALATPLIRMRGNLDLPMLWLNSLGAVKTLVAATLVPALLLAVQRRRREASFLLVLAGGALVLSRGLKEVFQRPRPNVTTQYLLHASNSTSFPSAHAFRATALLIGLVVLLKVLGLRRGLLESSIVAALLALLGVAAARVYFGAHFPSDVVGGILVGAGWSVALAGWFYRERTISRPV
ncbi:MAG: phosphatase PAP2 family protein [Polyangiaceae bacterium]